MITLKNLKTVLIGLCLVNITLTTQTLAATKCVKLTPATGACPGNAILGQMDWSATCSGTVSVRGIGGCSKNKGSSMGAKSDTLFISDSQDPLRPENLHCWCKIISPAVSKWVYAHKDISEKSCLDYCAAGCADYVRETSSAGNTMRTALFSDLSE